MNRPYLSHFAIKREESLRGSEFIYDPILDINVIMKKDPDNMDAENTILLSTETKTAVDAEQSDRDYAESLQIGSRYDPLLPDKTIYSAINQDNAYLMTETHTEIKQEQLDHLDSDFSLSLLATETFTKTLGERDDKDFY